MAAYLSVLNTLSGCILPFRTHKLGPRVEGEAEDEDDDDEDEDEEMPEPGMRSSETSAYLSTMLYQQEGTYRCTQGRCT